MGWDVSHLHTEDIISYFNFSSFNLLKAMSRFFFSLCPRDRRLSCRNAIQFSWSILIEAYQSGFRKLPLSLCVAPSGLVGFKVSANLLFFWHWQKILIPCIMKRSNSKTLHKPSKEKKIVSTANFEIIPWKRPCCILSSLLPFYFLEGVWIFMYPIVQESVIQISMEPPQGQSQAISLPELKGDLGRFF